MNNSTFNDAPPTLAWTCDKCGFQGKDSVETMKHVTEQHRVGSITCKPDKRPSDALDLNQQRSNDAL